MLHVGAKFNFEQVQFESREGQSVVREVVRHPGAVVVLPILESVADPTVVLIRNFRLSIEAPLWELPAGTLGPGEDPAVCAVRELAEETGYRAATVRLLGRYHLSPGMTDECMHAFIAHDLSPVGQHTEIDEFISVHPISLSRVLRMIDSGEITDAKTIATVLRFVRGVGAESNGSPQGSA
ncbi:MAG: NUDIX hydrolase [Phycisphaerales bacterium]